MSQWKKFAVLCLGSINSKSKLDPTQTGLIPFGVEKSYIWQRDPIGFSELFVVDSPNDELSIFALDPRWTDMIPLAAAMSLAVPLTYTDEASVSVR